MRLICDALLALSAATLSACATTSADSINDADRSSLLNEDERFDAAVAVGGIDAWMAELEPDSAVWDGGHLAHDRQLYATKMGPLLSKPGNQLRWHPEWADVDGDLGYTTGRWQLHTLGPNGSYRVAAAGTYCTVWHRQVDGTWRVAFDMGSGGR